MIKIQPPFNYSLINTRSIIKKFFNISLRRFLSIIKKCLFKALIIYNKINFYHTYFLSGGIKTSVDNILVSNKTKLIRLHSNNYDLHLKDSKDYKRILDENYDVYIDQNVTKSTDSVIRGENLFIPAKKYYEELNLFFDKLEKVTKRKIIISAHPKANIEELKKYNPNRKIIFNSNSASLIYYSNNVIVSYSMAIGFACLYNKNLILITNSSINNYKKSILNGISKYFRIKYINISKKYKLKNDFNNDKSIYKKYIDDFITPSRENKTLFSLEVFKHMNIVD